MFINNKYKKWYDQIIMSVQKQNRIYDSTIYEKHHITPKSMSGTNDENNIIFLTFREHYICHLLLTKFTTGKNKRFMCFALHTFFHLNFHRPVIKYSSYIYELHKKMFVEACKERIPVNLKKDKYLFSNQITGDVFIGSIKEFRDYSGLTPADTNWLTHQGIDPSDTRIRQIKNWGIWIETTNQFSYEKNMPLPVVSQLHKTYKCEHCNVESNLGNYKRWHGNKCKSIDPNGHNIRVLQVSKINKK